MNAGKTSHEGLELGFGTELIEKLTFDTAISYAKHTYEIWQPRVTVNYSGNEMESAPDLIANTRLGYQAKILNGGKVELEWVKLGEYWMDAENTEKYAGHDVYNLRINYHLNNKLEIYSRLMNITDERYATAAKYSPAAFGNPEKFEYSPGMPRTAYVGMKYKF